MDRDSAQAPPEPGRGVALARAWSEEEWLTVCAHRRLLHDLLQKNTSCELPNNLALDLISIAGDFPCFAIISGVWLFLDTTQGGQVVQVSAESDQRERLLSFLNQALSSPGRIVSLPEEDGFWEHMESDWERCWGFRNHDPSAFVCDRLLLKDPLRWVWCEAHERTHALGLDEQQAVEVELEVARLLVNRYPSGAEHDQANQLCAESEVRLQKRLRNQG